MFSGLSNRLGYESCGGHWYDPAAQCLWLEIHLTWRNRNLVHLLPQNSTEIHCLKAVFSEAFQEANL